MEERPMTAPLDATLDALDAAYWPHVLDNERLRSLDLADKATARRDFAAAYAALDHAWESCAVPAVCAWLAAPHRPCIPEPDGWCTVCSTQFLGAW